MITLTGYQRNFLRRKAHDLKPVVMLGKNGLTEEVTQAIDKALEDHELIKVKFIDFKDEKQSLSRLAAKKTKSLLIVVIGNIAVFYRENTDPDKKEIFLPGIHAKK